MAAYRSPLANLGLTYPRYLVLLALWEQDAVPIGTLGERLFLDFGTLSPLLKKLEADKLVARVRDTNDERLVRAVLTERGRNLRGSIERMQSDLACQLDLVPSSVDRLRKQLWMLLQDLMRAGSNMDESHPFNYGHRSRAGSRPVVGRSPRRRSDASAGIRWPRQGRRNKS
jgi:DNA-binding MarR family transcriptional regulator